VAYFATSIRKMIKAQLKSNFDSTFLLSLKEKTNVEERERAFNKREKEKFD
jgi:hypothetical protein